jgi:hypothetical protein
MQITVNEPFIQRRAKIARWSSLIGLGVLGLGLVISFNQELFYWSLPALIVGFFLANISSFNANRYVKEPRPDQVLAKALRGFDRSYHLFSYTAPIPYVLLTPSRLYAILVKPQDGVVRRQGNQWRRDFNVRRFFLFFGEEGLGNPLRDGEAEAGRLQRKLTEEFGEEAPPVHPLVVFSNPKVQLEVAEPSSGDKDEVPVLTGANLKKYIRGQGKGQAFSPELRQRLANFLGGKVSARDEDE